MWKGIRSNRKRIDGGCRLFRCPLIFTCPETICYPVHHFNSVNRLHIAKHPELKERGKWTQGGARINMTEIICLVLGMRYTLLLLVQSRFEREHLYIPIGVIQVAFCIAVCLGVHSIDSSTPCRRVWHRGDGSVPCTQGLVRLVGLQLRATNNLESAGKTRVSVAAQFHTFPASTRREPNFCGH